MIFLSFQELDLLENANIVYKLIGPVLVKQDLDEAKATVTKRLEYINGEMWVTLEKKLSPSLSSYILHRCHAERRVGYK